MTALADQAFTMDMGLILTFGGIGVLVNILLVYIVAQVLAERQQNRAERRNNGG